MIHPLLLVVGLLLPPHVERAWRHHAQADRTSRPQKAFVTARAVSDFLKWARQREPGSVVDVWKRAAEVFRQRGYRLGSAPVLPVRARQSRHGRQLLRALLPRHEHRADPWLHVGLPS